MLELQWGSWTLLEYFWYFAVFSFLGWCLEVAYTYYRQHQFINRGFLFGPFCPIYGLGTIIILQVVNALYHPSRGLNSLASLLQIFLIITVVTTGLEFLVGLLLEVLFDHRWWNYSDCRGNVKGYICAKFSMFWGIGGTGLYLLLNQLGLHNGFVVISPGLTYGAYILSGYFVADITKSVDLAFRLKIFLTELSEAAFELRDRVRDFNLVDLKLEATIRRGYLEEYINEIQQRLESLKGESRKNVEAAIHQYTALLRRERIKPFRHFIQAFPQMQYRRMEDALDIVRERFFLSRVMRRLEQRRSAPIQIPKIGRYMDLPATSLYSEGTGGLVARQLVALENNHKNWAVEVLELETGGASPQQKNAWPRIYVVLQGKAEVRIGEQTQVLEKGHYVFAPEQTLLGFRNAGPTPLVLLSVLSENHGMNP